MTFVLIRYVTCGSFLTVMIHLYSVDVWFDPEKTAKKHNGSAEFHCIHIKGKASISLYCQPKQYPSYQFNLFLTVKKYL